MSSPRPALFVPGLLCDAELFAAQIRDLSDLLEIQVADQGAGESVPETAAAILEKAPPSFVLAGLSMGGYLAFEILRQAPERVTRLALLDTAARADSQERREDRERQIELAGSGGFGKLVAAMTPKLVAPENRVEVGPVFEAMAHRVGPEGFIRQTRTILSRPDSRPDLAGIRVPSLVLVGTEDALTPPELAQEMAFSIPGARLALIEGAGHLAPLERPAAVTAALRDWLTAS
ncbi:alpha/beta fold hydrolase [Neomegalonema sp.]|uniref:alpha/beta fold hydrolase n=1 Tax=Neomegalonema sp. TaxID=2039713 RepID=UPI0026358B0E|nr:alpha/beta fold hydrolase [Neomegalonema sp.]MDD2869173.1 alpha/beta fold hydrolase [Neomegalonema sp.]